ncbi:hypothetical protein D3C73_1200930 [compost metagenome]
MNADTSARFVREEAALPFPALERVRGGMERMTASFSQPVIHPTYVRPSCSVTQTLRPFSCLACLRIVAEFPIKDHLAFYLLL